MKRMFPVILAIVAAGALLLTGGCSCGFNCSGSDDNDGGNTDTAVLTLGFSDSLPEDLKEVVIKVATITFRQTGANVDDVKVDRFTISELGATDEEDFQVDLLEYPGTEQLVVIKNLQLAPGLYDVFIDVLGGNINNSYVLDANDSKQQLNARDDDRLVLEDLQLEAGAQAFTVEFGLAQSLQFDTEDGYLLTENGIRFEDNAVDAQLSGTVDRALSNTVAPCNAKTLPLTGNRVYLYKGDQSSNALVDVYQTATTTDTPPSVSVAPFAATSPALDDANNWTYDFGYVPPGTYTLAFSCDSANDDSVEWDELDIPLPDNMKYRIELSEEEIAQCNLSAEITVNPGDCERSSR